MYVDSREKVTARYQVTFQSDQTLSAYHFHGTPEPCVLNPCFIYLYDAVNLPIKEGSHGVWEFQANRHTFTKSSQGLGMAIGSAV